MPPAGFAEFQPVSGENRITTIVIGHVASTTSKPDRSLQGPVSVWKYYVCNDYSVGLVRRKGAV